MADQAKPDEEDVIEDVEEQVETPNGEDENQDLEENTKESEAEDQEQEESESEEEESEDESKPEDKEESKFEKRFTQIKGDTPEEYAKNLEEAYRNSSTEGQRNATEAKESKEELAKIGAAIAKNPELAKMLNDALDGEPAPAPQKEDPAIAFARDEMKKKLDGEYNSFTELHPEMVTDEELRNKVLAELSFVADVAAAKGEKIGMEEGLKKAWTLLGLDEEDSKEETITRAKEIAGKPGTPGKTKTAKTKTQLTDEQISMGKRYGLSEKQLLEFAK